MFARCHRSQTKQRQGEEPPLELGPCHMHLAGSSSKSPALPSHRVMLYGVLQDQPWASAPVQTCRQWQPWLLPQAWGTVRPTVAAATAMSARDGAHGCRAGCRLGWGEREGRAGPHVGEPRALGPPAPMNLSPPLLPGLYLISEIVYNIDISQLLCNNSHSCDNQNTTRIQELFSCIISGTTVR